MSKNKFNEYVYRIRTYCNDCESRDHDGVLWAEGRIKSLEDAAIRRDGGVHDVDCKITRNLKPVCNCGHDELMALLEP